jgi:hypothetical protein
MSDEPRTELAFTPLARLLFGWTRAQGAGLGALAALGAVGATLVFAEILRPRLGLRLPMESQPGFYAIVGVGVVAGILAAAWTLRWLLQRDNPYKDEQPLKPEAGDDDRA